MLQGPGENAGVVDLGGGVAAVFKIESHNHPSFVEPFQGAATGVGGIIRDILAMGARPAASLNSLRFGDPAEPLQRRLLEGVVAGIGHYGNCVGVATVGGEVVFDPCYAGNPLVNALTVGFMPAERRLSGSAEQPGDLAVLMGAKTGRDGIGGASVLASASFEDGDEAKRPNVQVGDPFQEKLLIEACLELVERGLLRGLQDLGAAGISCAVAEVAARAGMGMEVDLDAVPLREPSMEAWEVLVSESQERMLALVDPARLADVLEVCRRWGILANVLGEMTPGTRAAGCCGCGSGARWWPRCRRPAWPTTGRCTPGRSSRRRRRPPGPRSRWTRTRPRPCSPWPPTRPAPPSAGCGSSTTASWATGPWPGPAATRPCSGSPGPAAAVALATDGNGRYAALDPAAGAALAVAEAARNVACTGAQPIAVTNCLNFASPERPEVMGAFAAAVDGMAAACRALGLPVTGGNVSFYNESSGRPIHPTPIVGVLGLLEDATTAVPSGFPRPGLDVWLLGETRVELGGSVWQRLATGRLEGRPPPSTWPPRPASTACSPTSRPAASWPPPTTSPTAAWPSPWSRPPWPPGSAPPSSCRSATGPGLRPPRARPGPLAALVSESASRVLLAVPAGGGRRAGGPGRRRPVSPPPAWAPTGGDRLAVPGVLDLPLSQLRDAYEARPPPRPRRTRLTSLLAGGGRRGSRHSRGCRAKVVVRGPPGASRRRRRAAGHRRG